jgi:hypothetical protein
MLLEETKAIVRSIFEDAPTRATVSWPRRSTSGCSTGWEHKGFDLTP